MIQPFHVAGEVLDGYRRYVRASFPLRDRFDSVHAHQRAAIRSADAARGDLVLEFTYRDVVTGLDEIVRALRIAPG